MAGGVPEIQIQVHSRKGGNSIYPVEPTTITGGEHGVYREIKHFKKWFPWLIPTFVIVVVVTFLVTMYVNNCPHNSVSCFAGFLGRFSFQPFSENPLLGPSSNTLEKMGALDVNKVVHEHQGWRLITCMWLHGGVFHLLANMLSLLVIGIRLEREFGFVRIGLLYIIAGLGGSLFSALFIKSNISVGASGALFGLLGSMLSELIINWTIYANKLGVLVTLMVIIVINLAVGILPHVDNFAHIGGFMSGFLLGFVFLIRPQFGWLSQRYASSAYSSRSAKPKFKVYQMVLWVISLILLIIGFTAGLVMLFRGVDLNDHCPWCHYMSCLPTSRWSCNTEPVSCMGAIDTATLEMRIEVTNPDHSEPSIMLYVENQAAAAMRLVSEMMILCGEVIATFGSHNNIPLPYRGQPQSNIDSSAFAHLPEGPVRSSAIVRIMHAAEMDFRNPIRHGVMGLPVYVQFISPIRRYMDLAAHYQVKDFLSGDSPPFSAGELEGIASTVNMTTRVVRRLSSSSLRYWILEYLRRQPKGKQYRALVLRFVKDRDATILLTEIGVHASSWMSTGVQIGDEVDVQVEEAHPRDDVLSLKKVEAV